MTRQHRVLIIGAGPCGLMAACELRRRGVAADVIDVAAEPPRGSRAILLWPPTLRMYHDLGILAEAERRGVTIRTLSYHLDPRRTLRVPLRPEMSPLILAQEDTDELLRAELARLGGAIEWGVSLTSLSNAEDHALVELQRGDGTTERRRAEWLIGADGVRSTTRTQLGIEFPGSRLPITYLLTEGRVTGEYDRDAINYYIGRAGGVLIAPLPGGRARISAPLPDGMQVADDTAQRMLDERGPGGQRVEDVTVNTWFTSHERIAARMRVGRCFLIGDAAHTHSVVGGQGLNLGFGDARNLAWKLTGVLDGRLDPTILDSYEVERRAAAEQVVQSTARMARQGVIGPIAVWLRNALMAAAHRAGALGRRLPPTLAGWAIRYPQALLEPAPGKPARSLPLAGARSPDWSIERHGDGDTFELVTVGPEDDPQRPAAAALARAHGALLTHRHVVAKSEGFVLLRPDDFVAASGRTGDFGWLSSALAKLAGANKELPR
jgi:2-polyprenyl-6-methoxyphenol hydroxylase-like FAD-dependent oxidoreductase